MPRVSLWDISMRARNRIVVVGYLTPDQDYPRGEVSELVFERLVRLVRHPFWFFCGHHDCNLDPCGSPQPLPELRYKGLVIPTQCSTDIYVPAEEVIYVAPALIMHYIRGHNYLPPAAFIEAVLACPDPTSPEYSAAFERLYSPNIDWA